MKILEFLCIICPLACNIQIKADKEKIFEISGYKCKKGKEYVVEEYIEPLRILTTTVKTSSKTKPLLPVRTKTPIKKSLLYDCIILLSHKVVVLPIKIGDVIIKNILDSKVDIISSKDLYE